MHIADTISSGQQNEDGSVSRIEQGQRVEDYEGL
jgi:hypothetical protein